jgi:hypothetical protein
MSIFPRVSFTQAERQHPIAAGASSTPQLAPLLDNLFTEG